LNGLETTILARRPGLVIIVTLGVLVASAWVSIYLVLGLLPIVGALCVYTCARRVSADPFLWKVALLNLTLTVVISVTLFLLSRLQPPWLSELILREGFWKFAATGSYYDLIGRDFAKSLHHGVPFPTKDTAFGGEYLILVGLLYFLFGVHPLIGSFFNATLGAMTVILVYGYAARMLPRSSRIAALFAALWPSSLLWASQLLKETMSVFLVFAALSLCLWLTGNEGKRQAFGWWVVGNLGLFAVTFMLCNIRWYSASALLVGVIISGGFLIFMRGARGQMIARHLVVVAMLAAGTISYRYLGSEFLVVVLSPNPPSVTFLRNGEDHAKAGRWQLAVSEYRQAIALKPDFWLAYYDLGLALIRLGDLPGARAAFERYLNLDRDEVKVREIERILSAAREQPAPPVAAPGPKPPPQVAQVRPREQAPVSQKAPPPQEAPASEAPPPVAAPGPKSLAQFTQELATNPLIKVRSSLSAILSLELILINRRGFISTGGDTLRTTDRLKDGSIWSIMRSIPLGMAAVMFSPYPWEWSSKPGGAGLLRVLAGMESLVLLILFPIIVWGAWANLRMRNYAGIQILAFSLVLMAVMGVAVVNAGTLFRLRLVVVVPLLIVAAVGYSSFDPEWIRAWRRHPSEAGKSG
jgi:hypothetical protein